MIGTTLGPFATSSREFSLQQMTPSTTVPILLLLLSVFHSASSSIVQHVHSKSSTVELPWSDINIVMVTDVHSWIAGHKQHSAIEHLDAGYGEVLSWYERLQAEQKGDLLFVMNGDFVDGTGLTTVPPEHLVPLLKQMPFSAVNMGNHELYRADSLEYLNQSGFFDHWGGNYLTSNTFWSKKAALNHTNDNRPIGNRYTYLKAPMAKKSILTFGFLFNFEGNCHTTRVETVQTVVQEEWFQNVLRDTSKYDAILMLAHMDYRDPLVHVLHQAIRKYSSNDMPLLFINGHSHIRGASTLDTHAETIEAGRFLDTVGFASMPWRGNAKEKPFGKVFIDANLASLQATLNISSTTSSEEFLTPNGEKLKRDIVATQETLGLLKPIGAVNQTYFLEVPVDQEHSVWHLFLQQVVPSQLSLKPTTKVAYIQGSGAFRYDLMKGVVTVNDVIAVAPFQDHVELLVKHMKGSDLRRLLQETSAIVNVKQNTVLPRYVSTVTLETVHDSMSYDLVTAGFDVSALCDILEQNLLIGCQPTQLYKYDGTLITTTSLWMDYFEDKTKDTPYLRMDLIFSSIALCILYFFWHLEQRNPSIALSPEEAPLLPPEKEGPE